MNDLLEFAAKANPDGLPVAIISNGRCKVGRHRKGWVYIGYMQEPVGEWSW